MSRGEMTPKRYLADEESHERPDELMLKGLSIQEAIEYNKNLREYMKITDKTSEHKFLQENYDALDMAIKALEQTELNPSYSGVKSRLEPWEDCISRAEALMHSHIEYDDDGEGHIVIYAEDIEDLPPVIPQQKIGNWIMNKEYNGYGTTIKDCKCPFCGEKALLKNSHSMDGQSIVFSYLSNYCPNCGAKLEVE